MMMMMMIASSLGHGIVPCQIMYPCLKEVICVNLRFSYMTQYDFNS